MALILNIDTSQDAACVSLAENGAVITAVTNETQRDHAAWIHRAIEKLFEEAGYNITDLAAVGVSNGPGSYTGLRIGLSTAKGLCYSLKVPLITVGTLEVMALNGVQCLGSSAKNDTEQKLGEVVICPMIDARRMEVFTAIYDIKLNEVVKPQALVLDSTTFAAILERQKILFLGNGSKKFQQMGQRLENAMFKNCPLNPSALAIIIYRSFIGNNFAALGYTEPLYLKEAYARRKPGSNEGRTDGL
jgi:tRNA threonylcarbamoyladenosine biosynthesis protein TsaB